MNNTASIRYRSVLALFVFVLGFTLRAAAATDARVSESYGKLPLQFEANRGQTHEDVHFLARGAGYSLYLTAGEAVLVLANPNAKAQKRSFALRMSLVGAAREPVVTGLDELPGKANYFIGKDRSKWRTNVPTYAKVQYRNVYPGVDLVYYGNQRQLEYDFVVAPGADPKKIALRFRGADKLEIDVEGNLVLRTASGDIHQHKPVIYQEIDGFRREVAGGYVRKGADRVGFQLAAYDTTRPLIIDPVVLSYSTYLGGGAGDFSNGIAVDAAGNAYVTGFTASSDFPTTAGTFQPNFGGAGGAFVTKLNPAGTALVYSTYLFGNGGGGNGIAVDADGNAYVAGGGFVAKLDPAGAVLIYSILFDGRGNGIALDADRSAYVTGQTDSPNFPTTIGAFQTTFAGGDAFVMKVDPTGSALVYSTYLGGSGADWGNGIAVDSGGNAYVTGITFSTDFPTTAGAFQSAVSGGAFVTKLDPAGSALVYSTYLGGSDAQARGIAVDGGGNAYVTGVTSSADFPTTAGAYQVTYGGTQAGSGGDAFVTKLDPTGSGLVYSTYLGGDGSDWGNGIAVDIDGNAYVTGTTSWITFPTTPDAFQPDSRGGSGVNGTDGFFTKLNPTGSALVYSTYLGGTDLDLGLGIALDAKGNAYVTGATNSTDFPTTAGAYQPALSGVVCCRRPASDAFVTKFGGVVAIPPTPTGPQPTRSEESAATAIGFWTSYGAETGTFSGGSIVASNVAASTALFSFTGTAVSWIGVKCNVCGVAAVSIDAGTPTTVNTAGPNAPGGLTSESVFSVSGLAASNHTISITVTGMSSSGGAYVAVDAFDVTAGSATSPPLPPVVLPPPPVVVPPLPPVVGL